MDNVLNQEVMVTIRVVVVSIMEAQDKLDSIQLVMIEKQNRSRQMMQQTLPDPVQISNLFGILGQLGGMEIPTH